MSYRHLTLAASILFGVLCLTLIFLPQIVYWLFEIQGNDLGDFLAKRAGVLFLGLTVLCYCSRKSHTVEVQGLVLLAVGSAMGAMAFLGIFEFIRGTVGAGIFVAVVIEAAIAFLFFAYRRKIHNAGQSTII